MKAIKGLQIVEEGMVFSAQVMHFVSDPIEQARIIVRYEKERGAPRGAGRPSKDCPVTKQDIADELGIHIATIQNLKRLLTLIPELQRLVSKGAIAVKTCIVELVKLTPQEQKAVYKAMPKNVRLSQTEVRNIVRSVRKSDTSDKDVEIMRLKAKLYDLMNGVA